MDKHFNVFYSYNQGKQETYDSAQLENNLTRALFVTLNNLDKEKQNQFVINLLQSKGTSRIIKSSDFVLDLQSTDKYKKLHGQKKFIVILQRDTGTLDLNKIKNVNTKFLSEIENDPEVRKKITDALKSDTQFQYSGVNISHEELNSILQLIAGNIPDAWVIGLKEVFLFESKVGNNKASIYQIYRHITGKKGFRVKHSDIKDSEVEIFNITWGQTCDWLKKIDENNLLVKEYIEYIKMAGQVIDFEYIIKKEFDIQIHKDQLKVFLTKFNEALSHSKANNLKPKNRGKAGLWEPYEIENQEEPHYTLYFSEDSIRIGLTTKKHKHINNNVLTSIKKFFENKKSANNLHQYYIVTTNYKLVDPAKGQQKGETNEPFMFEIRFPNIKNHFERISECILLFTQMKIYKQFELGLSVDFFDFDKIKDHNADGIRNINLRLLKDPENMISLFVGFVEETYDLFKQMKELN